LARTSATNSARVFAGTSRLISSSIGITPISATGWKSAIGSNGRRGKSARSTEWAMVL